MLAWARPPWDPRLSLEPLAARVLKRHHKSETHHSTRQRRCPEPARPSQPRRRQVAPGLMAAGRGSLRSRFLSCHLLLLLLLLPPNSASRDRQCGAPLSCDSSASCRFCPSPASLDSVTNVLISLAPSPRHLWSLTLSSCSPSSALPQ
ncbi:Hypothetical predicted protein [Marmota monax]|uniref:Uncharacterized protein n=1 Tax=Marmota monax TaxID=9995 RepID=A0A5E4B429_MARMO|nr:Hypothetical predicted protein [Marmota monax]